MDIKLSYSHLHRDGSRAHATSNGSFCDNSYQPEEFCRKEVHLRCGRFSGSTSVIPLAKIFEKTIAF